MGGQVILTTGVAFVAGTLGYMVGGSATSVVAVAVPVVFGLVVSSIGLMQASQPSKEILDLIKTAGDKADTIQEVIDYRARTKFAPKRIGITLIVFSIAYFAFGTLGAYVRINHLLGKRAPAHAYPWVKSETKPPTVSAALEWVELQSRLLELGYEESRILEIYEIQVNEWKEEVERIRNAKRSVDKAASAINTTDLSIQKKDHEFVTRFLDKYNAPKIQPDAPFKMLINPQ